jgi:hypothetical protein
MWHTIFGSVLHNMALAGAANMHVSTPAQSRAANFILLPA